MLHLRAALVKFDWNKYDIDAYCALVENGPSSANDVAIRSKIPTARIHTILKGLIKIGAVNKKPGRPALYDAQNPQYILDNEMKKLGKICEDAKENIVPLWEARAENNNYYSGSLVVEGYSGIVNEIRRLLDTSKSSLLITLFDWEWLNHKDIEFFENLMKQTKNVTIVGLERYESKLLLLSNLGIDVRLAEEINYNFCLADNFYVLWISDRMEHGTIIQDPSLFEILRNQFEDLYEKIEKMEADIIAN